ncbi:Upstream stimulatory factor 2 [Eumeta japonica]|uniref:Upstream stimulatory factor 2 n=1 Tax=Eumeta variegata TaxID=151549 RepID=A0A4C1VE91_EUMVA|nr:Upstream stimulatory factor 2 [Eumeta japonica]
MAKVEIDLGDNSLDNSVDGELLGMVSEGSIAGPVTYRFVSINAPEDASTTITADSPSSGQIYVISNPVEMYRNVQPATQKKVIHGDPIVATKKRDEKRRATHNEVERRRRDKINNWITKLARLVPDSGAADSASKGGILAKACDYITELSEKHKRFQKLEKEHEKLLKEVWKIKDELTELKKENATLTNQLNECKRNYNAQKTKPKCLVCQDKS